MRVGSDFSGVGAFDQALRRLNIFYETVFSCDMDKYARQSYIANYGEPKYYPTNVYEREIPKESLDIYMTSPPCQAFSLAGSRKGEKDDRGILFYNSHEFIKKNKPRYFIFENVKGLLSDDKGKTFRKWVDYLGGKSVNGNPVIFPLDESVPYHIYYKVLNAKKYGVPQNRERIFIVGIRDDEDNNFSWPKEIYLEKKLKDVLENEVEDKYFLSEKMLNGFINKQTPGFGDRFKTVNDYDYSMSVTCNAGSRITDNYIKVEKEVIQLNPSKESGGKQPYQQNRIYDKDGLSPCLTANLSTGGNMINTESIRRLTPRECFRLMDFPDDFKIVVSDTQAYKQAGNSIVVNVLSSIINKLVK